jgi:UDP-GlcNAc:undecaprenyl-phosphate GlcNAc-1-phosphate transferase
MLPLFFIFFGSFIFVVSALQFFKRRKENKGFFPRGGGLVLSLVSLFILTVIFFGGNFFGIRAKDYWSILIAQLIIIGGGSWDDRRGLSPIYQLGYQVLAILFLVLAGDLINHVQIPLLGITELPFWINILLTFFWFLVVLNSFNWFDGLNGLAGGSAVLSLAALFWINFFSLTSQADVTAMIAVTVGVTAGFLLFNFKGEIQLGTAGSGFLGLLLALFSVYLGGKVAAAAFILALPVLDFFWVCFLRIKNGERPWQGGDRRHLHYYLIDKGWRKDSVVSFFYFGNFILGILAFLIQGILNWSSFFFLVAVLGLILGGQATRDCLRFKK